MDEFFEVGEVKVERGAKDRIAESLHDLRLLNAPWSADESSLINEVMEYLDYSMGGRASIAFIEELLSRYKARRKAILHDELPTVLHEIGTTKLTDDHGDTVELRQDVNVSCPTDQQSQLYRWLMDEGHAQEIKTTIQFEKGDFTEEVEKSIRRTGTSFVAKETVHPQTLKRIFRDRVTSAESLPPAEIAKITAFEYAKVKQ